MTAENPATAAAKVAVKSYVGKKKEAFEETPKKTGHDDREEEVRALIQRIQGSFNAILERRRKVEGFGMLYIHYGKFGDILTELFTLYELGFYNSTILLCGTLAERICYDLIDFMKITIDGRELDAESKKRLYKLSFRELLDFLVGLNYISEKDSSLLHEIYNTRNRYSHLAEGGNVESDSITTLNRMCRVLVSLFDIFKFYDVRDGVFYTKGEYKDRVVEQDKS
jgi:hypothetical protein